MTLAYASHVHTSYQIDALRCRRISCITIYVNKTIRAQHHARSPDTPLAPQSMATRVCVHKPTMHSHTSCASSFTYQHKRISVTRWCVWRWALFDVYTATPLHGHRRATSVVRTNVHNPHPESRPVLVASTLSTRHVFTCQTVLKTCQLCCQDACLRKPCQQ